MNEDELTKHWEDEPSEQTAAWVLFIDQAIDRKLETHEIHPALSAISNKIMALQLALRALCMTTDRDFNRVYAECLQVVDPHSDLTPL